MGAVFFTILTSIISGVPEYGAGGGGMGDIITLQFLLIFLFIPMISIMFMFIIKTSSPGGE